MTPISRGFGGRRRDDVDPSRLPPGHYYERGFPVLSAGPTPRTPLGGLAKEDHHELSFGRVHYPCWAGTELRRKDDTMNDNDRDRHPRWGLLLGRPGAAAPARGSHLDAGRIHRWGERQPDLQEPSWSRRGGRDRLRPRAHLLPRHPRVLLPDPRPDDQGPPGQRHRLQLPLGDLLHERRAAPGRRGHDRRRRRLGPVARQGGDRGQRGRPVLGGRARAPGLPPALPERLHLPLPAPRLEAPHRETAA